MFVSLDILWPVIFRMFLIYFFPSLIGFGVAREAGFKLNTSQTRETVNIFLLVIVALI